MQDDAVDVVPRFVRLTRCWNSGWQGGHDYINASSLQSAAGELPAWSYIATQGPLENTAGDFWRMVRWYHRVLAVPWSPDLGIN